MFFLVYKGGRERERVRKGRRKRESEKREELRFLLSARWTQSKNRLTLNT